MNFSTIIDVLCDVVPTLHDSSVPISRKIFVVESLKDYLSIVLDQYKNDRELVDCLQDIYTCVRLDGEKNEKDCI